MSCTSSLLKLGLVNAWNDVYLDVCIANLHCLHDSSFVHTLCYGAVHVNALYSDVLMLSDSKMTLLMGFA